MQNELCKISVQRGFLGVTWAAPLGFSHPFWWLCCSPCPSQRWPQIPTIPPNLTFLQCSHFFHHSLDESRQEEEAELFLTFQRRHCREQHTNTYSDFVSLGRAGLQGFQWKLLYFICCSSHLSKFLEGVEDRKVAARCQIFPQTLFFEVTRLNFCLLQFQAVASSFKMQYICSDFK